MLQSLRSHHQRQQLLSTKDKQSNLSSTHQLPTDERSATEDREQHPHPTRHLLSYHSISSSKEKVLRQRRPTCLVLHAVWPNAEVDDNKLMKWPPPFVYIMRSFRCYDKSSGMDKTSGGASSKLATLCRTKGNEVRFS
eukprot:scaffold58_cov79-Skeletonema_marinoi.AAC.2